MRKAAVAILLLLLTSCAEAPVVSYALPVLPLSLSLDADGELRLSVTRSFLTPFGRFAVGESFTRPAKQDPQRTVYLTIRDRRRPAKQQDAVYVLRTPTGQAVAELDGKTTVTAERSADGLNLVIDVSSGSLLNFYLNDGSTQEHLSSPAQASPAPAPGTVLYQADWSTGRTGWIGTGDWTIGNGILGNTGDGDAYELIAPFAVNLPDYVIEASMRHPKIREHAQKPATWGFGVLARGQGHSVNDNYKGGVRNDQAALLNKDPAAHGQCCLADRPYTLDENWHIYRLDLKADLIKLSVDGTFYIEAFDRTYQSGPQVGVWTKQSPVDIQWLRVVSI